MDTNNEFFYVLQWIKDSVELMSKRIKQTQRNINAYNHIPMRNTYKEVGKRFDERNAIQVLGMSNDDVNRIKCALNTIPDGESDIFYKAVETNVNQLSGGIGQFQTTLYDKRQVLDDGLEEMLSLASERVYYLYGIDKLRDQAVRDMMLSGACYFYPYYDKNIKDIQIELISQDQIIVDPIRYRKNGARYVGFHKMISWAELEKEVTFERGFMKTINDAKVYATKIQDIMNGEVGGFEYTTDEKAFLQSDIREIYDPNKYKSVGTTNDAKLKTKYNGLDVEISYVWDLNTGEKFSVINRRFIISCEKDSLKAVTNIEVELTNQIVKQRIDARIKSPIIEIPYKVLSTNNNPATPLDLYGNTFDELCALDSLKKHNESLVGTITPYGTESDLALLANSLPISGASVAGLDGTIGFLQKSYDVNFLNSAVLEREQRIRESMNAYSQMDMVQMIGDRASAKEAGQAHNAVSAGHNALIHNLEIGLAEIIRVVNLLIVRYDSNKIIKVQYRDELDTVPIEKLALDAVLNVRLKSEVERERQNNALMASQLLNIGTNNPYINQEVFMPAMLKIAFGNLFSDNQLKNMIKTPINQQALDTTQLEAENRAKELMLEQQAVEQYPVEKMALMMNEQMTPEDKELYIQQTANNAGQNSPYQYEEPYQSDVNAQQPTPADYNGADNDVDDTYKQDKLIESVNDEIVPSTKGLDPSTAGEISNSGGL